MAICGLAQTTNLLTGKLACSSMARPVHLCALSMPSSKSLCCMLSTFSDGANYTALTANPWLAPMSQSPAGAAVCNYNCNGCVAPINYGTMGPPQCISPIEGLLQCPATPDSAATPMNNALKQQQAAHCFGDPAVPDSDRQGHRRVSSRLALPTPSAMHFTGELPPIHWQAARQADLLTLASWGCCAAWVSHRRASRSARRRLPSRRASSRLSSTRCRAATRPWASWWMVWCRRDLRCRHSSSQHQGCMGCSISQSARYLCPGTGVLAARQGHVPGAIPRQNPRRSEQHIALMHACQA